MTGAIGSITAGIVGAAWSLATFLAVPLIALEGLGPVEALKRSSVLFRERWGEQVSGRAGVGLIIFLLGLLPAGMLIWIGFETADSAGLVMIALGVLVAAVALLLGQAARGVFAVALYRYASGSTETGPFSAQDLNGAVSTKAG